MSAKSSAVTVAVIGAVATVGAALIAELHKGAPSSPASTLQQTASGAGAINVGRDAVFNNTVSKSAGEEGAERVQACEAQHSMKTSTEKKEWVEPASNGDPARSIQHEDFRSCFWPKSRYADGDGYLEIKIASVSGPGESEASGDDEADRITAPCPQVALTYHYGHTGYFQNSPPFTAVADAIVGVDGKPWKGDRSSIPFYPDTGEIVVLRSGRYQIEAAKCP